MPFRNSYKVKCPYCGYETELGEIINHFDIDDLESGMVVRHECDNPECNHDMKVTISINIKLQSEML